MAAERPTVIALLAGSVLSLILGPVVILMGSLEVNPSMIGGILVILGAIGLYAGMKALDHGKGDS